MPYEYKAIGQEETGTSGHHLPLQIPKHFLGIA
jgi:hypothetical protein